MLREKIGITDSNCGLNSFAAALLQPAPICITRLQTTHTRTHTHTHTHTHLHRILCEVLKKECDIKRHLIGSNDGEPEYL